ncbi:JAB domain-containing protein [Paracoccus aurantiacus]|uniref:JAB domain-containing protein n=1 Tax=Paracoccus aurantiacus TaxID=2599412 RepID=A0A5C6S6B3_9RHOB|nr:DNA repair protein RadC [Paracoccus aurantiacus]TXB69857.1 JAB domain-containing protein [Paracoccus aurantiacus]
MTANRTFQEPPLPLFLDPEGDSDEAPAQPVAARPGERRGAAPSYLADHRARLRERFIAGGADPMPDYELLELILFRAIPRQDVKPLARRLIDTFGDFSRVLSATPARLSSVPGAGPAVVTELKIVAAAANRLARSRVMHRPVLSGWDALLDYCHTAMSHAGTEEFRVLFLDRKNVLIADEPQGRGTVDHVPVYPREILRRALELGASAIILVHNHPSGDPTPSQADITMTQRIQIGADVMGITVHDHLVIGAGREVSFRREGLL